MCQKLSCVTKDKQPTRIMQHY